MATNLLVVLNHDDKYCVDILQVKYGNFNLWSSAPPPKSSWFIKTLCKIAESVRTNVLINACNPNNLMEGSLV